MFINVSSAVSYISSCFIVESIWDWGNDIIRGDGGLSTFLLLWPVDASLTGLSNLDSEEFPYSCGNSKFNTISLKVLSTISDLFVLYLQPACEEIFVQSVATGYSAAKNISPASKKGHCVYMMLHQQGNQLDSSVEANVKIKKWDWGNSTSLPFQKCRKPKKSKIERTEDVGSALPMHLECSSSNDVPLMFQGKISGARDIRFFWFELWKQPDGPTKWKSKRIWMVETSWKQAQRNHLDSLSVSNVHVTCNGQATRSPTSASRRHFCTRTWVHKCLPFLMAGVPVEPVEPIRFHLDSVRFVFEVRIGWLLAFENLCCENCSTWVYMIKKCCVCGHLFRGFISCFWLLLSTPLQRDSLFWPKRFGPEQAKHRVMTSVQSTMISSKNPWNSRDARGIAGKLGKITASIVPWHVLSSPLRQVLVGLRPLEPFTKSGVSPKANHQLPKTLSHSLDEQRYAMINSNKQH